MFIPAVATPKIAAATNWRRVQPRHAPRDTASRPSAPPMTRTQATPCGSASSNSSAAIVAPVYWATADRTNNASGVAVSRNRPTDR